MDSALPATRSRHVRAADAVLLGAVGDPSCDHLPREQRPEAGLLALRAALGAFANLRPARTEPRWSTRRHIAPEAVAGADVLIVRELLGGLYYGSAARRQPRRGAQHDALLRATRSRASRASRSNRRERAVDS